MSFLRTQARLTQSIFKVGRDKIWLDPSKKKEIAAAKTRDDIRELIASGVIKKTVKEGAPVHNPDRLRGIELSRERNRKKQKRIVRQMRVVEHHERIAFAKALEAERALLPPPKPHNLAERFPHLFEDL